MDFFEEVVLNEVNKENLLETVNCFNHLYRYSGTEQGEKAVSYIEGKLDSYGVSYEHCEYDGFFSLPVSAELSVGEKKYSLIADVYSKEANDLKGELVYDHWSEKKKLTQLENQIRFQALKGKLVLSWDGKGNFAAEARRAGALAVIHICPTKGDYIHHSNIGIVWGTPDPDQEVYMQFLPSAGIRRSDGEALIEELKKEKVCGSLSIKMDTDIRKSSMTIADIPGMSDSYILVSAHYDSWYEGITDNAVSDAILLEYARLFKKYQKDLKRGIRIAWWSGHSDGRFSGSAWYCDSHWQDLNDHCVAHINLDLTGCKNSDQIITRTAGTEGISYTGKLIKKYTGREPETYIPMIRGADQSFWGVSVPITIMLKYEPIKEKRMSDCPSGGPWWHTNKDTIDKLDEAIMMRDAAINLEMICDIQESKVLPVNISEFMTDMGKRLETCLSSLTEDFDKTEIKGGWRELETKFRWLADKAENGYLEDKDVKETVGKLLHLIYCRKDPYHHDYGDGFGIFGSIGKFGGITRENTTRDYYVMAQTGYMRNKNRLCDGMKDICRYIDNMQKRP